MNCTDEYEIAFIDGFKAAMEFVKSRVAMIRTWYDDCDDINYEAGGRDALDDVIQEIER